MMRIFWALVMTLVVFLCMFNSWLLLIIGRWIMAWNKTVFCLEVLIYKCLQMWHHNGCNEYLIFTLSESLPFLRYIHCNFCLNLHITHEVTKENVSGCFFWTQCGNLGPILPLFRDIAAFVRQRPLFHTPPLFRVKFRGVPFGVDPWWWGVQRANTPG